MKDQSNSSDLKIFLNKRLKGIVFAHDYIDLAIGNDGEYDDIFTLRGQLTVARGDQQRSNNDAGFKDDLFELVGKSISKIDLKAKECVFVFEKDSARLILNLFMSEFDLNILAHCEDQGIYLVNYAIDR